MIQFSPAMPATTPVKANGTASMAIAVVFGSGRRRRAARGQEREIDVGDVEHRGAAQRRALPRPCSHTFRVFARCGDALPPASWSRSPKMVAFGRTGLGAGRLAAGRDAVVAENAFANIGNAACPVVARNAVRAGHHAVAAAHAFVAVVDHRADVGLDAGRLPGRPRRRPAPGNGGIACAHTRASDLPRRTSSSRAERPSSGSQRRGTSAARWFCFLQASHAFVAADALGGVGKDGSIHLYATSLCTAVGDFQPCACGSQVGFRVAQRGGHALARAGGKLPGDRRHQPAKAAPARNARSW